MHYSSLNAEQLIAACAETGDPSAWAEFVARFQRGISLSIVRVARQWGETPQHVVDDLVQETYLKLCSNRCAQLSEFATQHPDAIVGYIKTVAVNVAHDYFKSRHSKKRGAGEVPQSIENVEPKGRSGDLGAQGSMERAILLKEIDECLATCSQGNDQERDRLIFWLYYQQGMSAKAIAALPTIGLTAKGVESALFRLTRLVRERMAGIRLQPETGSQPDKKGFRPAESY